jgi:glycosyltransferase involved in cell wall biosynthesis
MPPHLASAAPPVIGLHVVDHPLRIAMLAPPWISTPPPGYGGVETVVSDLTEALVERGHDVTLLCAPGSRSAATVVELLDQAHPDEIERSIYESDHVARAFAHIDAARLAGAPFDVVHDHCGFTALAMADRLATPVVHTLHGPFTAQTGEFYAMHGHKARTIAISATQRASAPVGLRGSAIVANPIDAAAWPFRAQKDDYLFWIGRMTPEKGPHRAIAVARAAGVPLILAGVVQPGQREYFDEQVAPHIDGVQVRFLGEVTGARKRNLFAGARALLMPIRWNEPFGLVMIEALVTGTPVIAFPEGAARELVVDGETGFLADSVAGMAAAVGRLDEIVPRRCRDWVLEHCDVTVAAAGYEVAYRAAIEAVHV